MLNDFIFLCKSPNNCSGKDRGKCVQHTCVCIGDWISADCSVHACPDNCGVHEGRGVCMKEHCRCKNVSSSHFKTLILTIIRLNVSNNNNLIILHLIVYRAIQENRAVCISTKMSKMNGII